MSKEEIAWLAGILDAEGCFDFNQNNIKYLRIRIQMKDRDVVERVQALCGGRGTIRLEKRKKNPNHSDTYKFQVGERTRVEEILKLIYPWMSKRRKQKIDIMLNK